MKTEVTYKVVQNENVLHTESKTFTGLRKMNREINQTKEAAMLKEINKKKDELNKSFGIGSHGVKLEVEYKIWEDAK